jgi:hypothetical protein
MKNVTIHDNVIFRCKRKIPYSGIGYFLKGEITGIYN